MILGNLSRSCCLPDLDFALSGIWYIPYGDAVPGSHLQVHVWLGLELRLVCGCVYYRLAFEFRSVVVLVMILLYLLTAPPGIMSSQ